MGNFAAEMLTFCFILIMLYFALVIFERICFYTMLLIDICCCSRRCKCKKKKNQKIVPVDRYETVLKYIVIENPDGVPTISTVATRVHVV